MPFGANSVVRLNSTTSEDAMPHRQVQTNAGGRRTSESRVRENRTHGSMRGSRETALGEMVRLLRHSTPKGRETSWLMHLPCWECSAPALYSTFRHGRGFLGVVVCAGKRTCISPDTLRRNRRAVAFFSLLSSR